MNYLDFFPSVTYSYKGPIGAQTLCTLVKIKQLIKLSRHIIYTAAILQLQNGSQVFKFQVQSMITKAKKSSNVNGHNRSA